MVTTYSIPKSNGKRADMFKNCSFYESCFGALVLEENK